jgi:uncharacterized Zn finger protein (UPF0148 family)
MKSKEYLKKYNLTAGYKSSIQKEFLGDLTSELIANYEMFGKEDNEHLFDVAVNNIRAKWDAISNKVPYGLPDGVWNYFWATVVVPMKATYCPTFQKRKDRESKERRERYQEEKKQREQQRKAWEKIRKEESFKRVQQNRFNAALAFLFLASIPIDSFAYFGLSANATKEQVMEEYRKKAMTLHPDRGGSNEKFMELIENKNKCLKWIIKG